MDVDVPSSVDLEMVDAPDLIDDDDVDSVVDIEMPDAPPLDDVDLGHLVDVSVVSVDMLDADDMIDESYEPLLCQGSPLPALPAPTPPTLNLSTMSAALDDMIVKEEEQEQPMLAHPVLDPLPTPVSADFDDDTAMDQQDGVADETISVSIKVIVAISSPLACSRRTDSPGSVQLQLHRFGADTATAPPTEPATINFDFEQFEYPEERPIAQPQSRLQGRQGQSSASASATAPTPVAPVASSSAFPGWTSTTPSSSANNAPHVSSSPSSPTVDKGKGKASESSPEAEPADNEEEERWKEILDDDEDARQYTGTQLRMFCEDMVSEMAIFMNHSPTCASLSPRWVAAWKEKAMEQYGPDDNPDDYLFDRDSVESVLRRWVRFAVVLRSGGLDSDQQNAILPHVKEVAAEEGLDLGNVVV
ncbi:hypothetical protein C8A03DRAFT_37800 [Achaetomium macrosporum]|uniref:Uncharacterized protein n=1 Tax=Achaetomium macrosporum TaxID=79813 RepID=A0AAN7C302_9PEZI|nr:hypothetical protein C8A03DRAFT_37800 [Achaetomium macrosporum]